MRNPQQTPTSRTKSASQIRELGKVVKDITKSGMSGSIKSFDFEAKIGFAPTPFQKAILNYWKWMLFVVFVVGLLLGLWLASNGWSKWNQIRQRITVLHIGPVDYDVSQ
jgi:hypothetical protein